jgi:acetyl-CoA acyltransferase
MMAKQIQDAYIVAATRTAVGKAPRGMYKNTRPDDLLAHVLKSAVAQCPGLDLHEIGDVITGCAMPEGEQGMNVARIGLLLAGFPDTVPGLTINRFCSSGVQAVADAAARIRLGEADVMIASGTESMSMVPMGGNKPTFSPAIFEKNEHFAIAWVSPRNVSPNNGKSAAKTRICSLPRAIAAHCRPPTAAHSKTKFLPIRSMNVCRI